MKQLLLIEDDIVLRALLTRLFSRINGVEIIVAGSVQATKELLTIYDPDFVIADIQLSDGVVFEALGDDFSYPVIFVTGYLDKYQNLFLDRPDVQILEKPVSLAILRKWVEERLALSPQKESSTEHSPFSALDYARFCFASMRSLTIRFFDEEGDRGLVTILNGVAWSAEDPIGVGMPALRRLMHEKASFKIESPTKHSTRTIRLPSHTVIRDLTRFGQRVKKLVQDGEITPNVNYRRGSNSENQKEEKVSRTKKQSTKNPNVENFSEKRQLNNDDLSEENFTAEDTLIFSPDREVSFKEDSDEMLISKPKPESDSFTASPKKESIVFRRASSRIPPRGSVLSPQRARFLQLKDEALRALLSHDYSKALTAFNAAAELYPDDTLVVANIRSIKKLNTEKK